MLLSLVPWINCSGFADSNSRNGTNRHETLLNPLKRGGHPAVRKDAVFSKEVLTGYATFDDFVLNWLTPGRRWPMPHFRPQFEYLTVGDRMVMDFVGRYENLAADFEVVRKRLGVETRLKHLNRTPVEDLAIAAHYANDAVVRRVQDVYRKDFELLGYPSTPSQQP